jgi:hypothetical protein
MTKIKDIHIYARAFFRFKNLSMVKVKTLAAELGESEYRITGLLRAAKQEPTIVDKLHKAGYNILDIPEGFCFTDYHRWLRKQETSRRIKDKQKEKKQVHPTVSPPSIIEEHGRETHFASNIPIEETQYPTRWPSPNRIPMFINYDDLVRLENAAIPSRTYWDMPINLTNYYNFDYLEEKEDPFVEEMKFIMEIAQIPALADPLIEAMSQPRRIYEANQKKINEFMCAILEADMNVWKINSEKKKSEQFNEKGKKYPDMLTEILEWNYRNRNL